MFGFTYQRAELRYSFKPEEGYAAAPCSDIYSNSDSREKFFENVFFEPVRRGIFFSNESLSRCDRFCQIFVQIGAILAIFRPFENFLAA